MNYDVTLLSRANQPASRPLPTDIGRVEDHIGAPIARSIQLRQACSAWLYRLAERIAPRPARTESDALFEAISAMLTEPVCEVSSLKTASQTRC